MTDGHLIAKEYQMKKTVMITGTSTGIGNAAAQLFHRKGWNVAATIRSIQKKPMEFDGLENLKCFTMDVTEKKEIERAALDIMDEFGTIDVLVNNAGVYATGPLETIPDNQIRHIFEVNVQGTINVTKALIPYLRRQNGGTIINVSSIAAKVTFPFQSIYHGSKWAIEGFSQGLAHELKQFGIQVKTVTPGMVKTHLYNHVLTMPENSNTEVYRKTFARWHAYLMGNYDKGNGPEESAEMIYKAATDKHAKMTYAAGLDAKMVLFLKRIMPHCLFNTMVRRSVGI
jgi:NADP-dependent 3-hydroxy acid dehydrogenase YdfG